MLGAMSTRSWVQTSVPAFVVLSSTYQSPVPTPGVLLGALM